MLMDFSLQSLALLLASGLVATTVLACDSSTDATPEPLRESTGYITVEDGFRIWYWSIGGGASDEKPALVMLHGGPGAPHDYLENLKALASPTQRVIFYDQLGCGKSDAPDEPARWRVPRFVDELARVREALGLTRVVLFGQSWGGMLAIEYLLTKPAGVEGLILANSLASVPLWVSETRRLLHELPKEVWEVVEQHEAAGTTDSPEYAAAMEVFYNAHVCRVQPWPDFVMRSMQNVGKLYSVMLGPSEFTVTGLLKDWDRSDRLGEITVPTLIISGEFDESTPAQNRVLHEGIAGSRWELMKNCSHLAHVEDPDTYMALVRAFLK